MCLYNSKKKKKLEERTVGKKIHRNGEHDSGLSLVVILLVIPSSSEPSSLEGLCSGFMKERG